MFCIVPFPKVLITSSFKSEQVLSTYYALKVVLLHRYRPKKPQHWSTLANNNQKSILGTTFKILYEKAVTGKRWFGITI